MNGYLNGRSQTIFTMISCCFGALALRIPIIHLVYTNWPDNLARIGAIAPMVSGFMAVYTAAYLCIQFTGKTADPGRFRTARHEMKETFIERNAIAEIIAMAFLILYN